MVDLDNIYKIPEVLSKEGFDDLVIDQFNLKCGEVDLQEWRRVIKAEESATKIIIVGMVGKYLDHSDAYKSLNEALRHAGIPNNVKVKIQNIDSESLENTDDLSKTQLSQVDAILVPGGFGAAKNLNQWAISGPEGTINGDVKRLILNMVKAGKPVAGLCMGPTVIAKALEGEDINASLTVGSTEAPSPYDIEGISNGMNDIGALTTMATIEEVIVDHTNKIVSAPCYMMEASIQAVRENIAMAIIELINLTQEEA